MKVPTLLFLLIQQTLLMEQTYRM